MCDEPMPGHSGGLPKYYGLLSLAVAWALPANMQLYNCGKSSKYMPIATNEYIAPFIHYVHNHR